MWAGTWDPHKADDLLQPPEQPGEKSDKQEAIELLTALLASDLQAADLCYAEA